MSPLRFAVVGDPIAHSKSPAMHAAAFAALGLPHVYESIRATRDELADVVRRVRAGELAGLNVTVPHKRAVLALVDVVDREAALVGAANVVYVRGGVLHATNTDAAAMAQELAALGVVSPVADALVLGSGGAARAALVALGDASRVVVRARSAQAIVTEMQPKLSARLSAEPLATSENDGDFTCIIQATSAGMTGADHGDAVAACVDLARVRTDAVVLETIYAPRETPLLRAARARGLRATNGLGMLARQGALAFEQWLGMPAPLDVMVDSLR